MKSLILAGFLLLATAVEARISTIPIERLELRYSSRCKDSEIVIKPFRLQAFIQDEAERFFQLPDFTKKLEVKNKNELHLSYENKSIRLGILTDVPSGSCESHWIEGASEIILDSRYSVALNGGEIQKSCRADGGIADFSGKIREVLYTDLLLIDNDTNIASNIANMMFFKEEESCRNFKTIGSGILSILLSPVLLLIAAGC